jgi:hypothetical protein
MERTNPVEKLVQFLNAQPLYRSSERIRSEAQAELARAAGTTTMLLHSKYPEVFESTDYFIDELINSAVERREDVKGHIKFTCITGSCALALLLISRGQPFSLKKWGLTLAGGVALAAVSHPVRVSADWLNRHPEWESRDRAAGALAITYLGGLLITACLVVKAHEPYSVCNFLSVIGYGLGAAAFCCIGWSPKSYSLSLSESFISIADAEEI